MYGKFNVEQVYCGDNVKYGLFSKHLFQRTQQHGGWKSPSE